MTGVPQLILGLSGKARHGKNTTADLLDDIFTARGYVVRQLGFADAVKERAREVGWNGEKDANGRTLLQYIGQRERESDPDYWVIQLLDRIGREATAAPTLCVVTDCRHYNEADAIHGNGNPSGQVWRIVRTLPDGGPYHNGLSPEQLRHPSETALDDYPDFDAEIVAGDLSQLKDLVTFHALHWLHELRAP